MLNLLKLKLESLKNQTKPISTWRLCIYKSIFQVFYRIIIIFSGKMREMLLKARSRLAPAYQVLSDPEYNGIGRRRVILPPCEDGNVRFTTVLLKPLSQKMWKISSYLNLEVLIFKNFTIAFL